MSPVQLLRYSVTEHRRAAGTTLLILRLLAPTPHDFLAAADRKEALSTLGLCNYDKPFHIGVYSTLLYCPPNKEVYSQTCNTEGYDEQEADSLWNTVDYLEVFSAAGHEIAATLHAVYPKKVTENLAVQICFIPRGPEIVNERRYFFCEVLETENSEASLYFSVLCDEAASLAFSRFERFQLFLNHSRRTTSESKEVCCSI